MPVLLLMQLNELALSYLRESLCLCSEHPVHPVDILEYLDCGPLD